MISSPLGLLWFLGAVCALFAVLMVWGVRLRKRQLAGNLDIRARDLTAPLAAAGWDPAGMLYGVRQDFSATKAGLVVRDTQDREVARITYVPLTREGWIEIETGAGRFAGDVLATLGRPSSCTRPETRNRSSAASSGSLGGDSAWTRAGAGAGRSREGHPGNSA